MKKNIPLSEKLNYPYISGTLKKKIYLLGENDFYPQLYIENSLLKTSSRIKFWNFLAKRNKNFSYFYSDNPEVSFERNTNLDKSDKYYKYFKEFYKNGIVEIKDFFNKKEHNSILSFLKKNNLKNLENNKNKSSYTLCKDPEINGIIHNRTKTLEKNLFGKELNMQNYGFSCFKKNKGDYSEQATSTLWHPDRFIPAIKLMYYPTNVEIDPFEYVLNSHIINQQFFNNIYKIIEDQVTINDSLLKAFKDSNYLEIEKLENKLNSKIDFNNYSTKKFNCKGNTLLIVATHGLHRRSQTRNINKEGIRSDIIIGFFNQYTRYNLLKLMFSNQIFIN